MEKLTIRDKIDLLNKQKENLLTQLNKQETSIRLRKELDLARQNLRTSLRIGFKKGSSRTIEWFDLDRDFAFEIIEKQCERIEEETNYEDH